MSTPAAPFSFFVGSVRLRSPSQVVTVKGDVLAIGHPKLGRHPGIIAATAKPITPHIPQALANLTSFHVTPADTFRIFCSRKAAARFQLCGPSTPPRRRRGRGRFSPPAPPPGPGKSAAAEDFYLRSGASPPKYSNLPLLPVHRVSVPVSHHLPYLLRKVVAPGHRTPAQNHISTKDAILMRHRTSSPAPSVCPPEPPR